MCQVVSEIFNPFSNLMRNLLDNASNTNIAKYANYNITNKRLWLNKCSEEIAREARNKQEWRLTLNKGDVIDAISCFETPYNQHSKSLHGWSPAKIVMVDTNHNILVSFLRCPKSNNRKLSVYSPEIAPQGTYTDDWEWRFDMKEDDVFDCSDDYGQWYRSTCLKPQILLEETDVDGNSIPHIVVGYRHVDPNGLKEDHKGRKCTGYTLSKFDAQMCLAWPNIQPLNNLTTQYSNVGSDHLTYEVKVNDVDDWVYPSKKIHQWARKRDDYFGGIQFFADVLNEFGQIGGFEVIEELYKSMAGGFYKTEMSHVLAIQQFLKRCLPLWTRQFSCKFSPQIAELFGQVLSSENSSLLINCQPDGLKEFVGSYSDMLKRVVTRGKINQLTNALNVKLGAVLLKSENFLKRIQGVSMIADEVRSARGSASLQQKIITELISSDVFSMIFSQERFHLQIAQRSVDIIKLYITEKNFNQQHIDMLWESTLVGETALIEVYRIIQETSPQLPDEIIECFIKKITDSMEPSKVTIREVEFLHSIGKNAYFQSQARKTAINSLWVIFMQEKPGYSRALSKLSRKHFCDLLRNMESDYREDFINRSMNIIAFKQSTSIQAIKIMRKVIEMFPRYVNQYNGSISGIYQQKTLSKYVADVCEKQNLINLILDDLENYLKGQAMDEGYSHTKNVAVRLKFIKFILDSVDDKKILNAEHVERTWGMLYLQSKEDSDASLLFDWFSQVLGNQLWCQEHSDVICNLFQTYILNNVQKLFQQGANSNGFQCIQTLFIYVNEKANNLNVLNRSAMNIAAANSRSKPKSSFRVNEMPNLLFGIDLLWQFFEAACHKRDSELQTNVIQFLTQVYLSQGNINIDRKQEIYEEFTKQCFDRMEVALSKSDSQPAAKYDIIKNTMQILLTFFEDCERKGGTASIRPHAALDSSVYFIQNLIVTSYLYEREQPKYIVLNLPSNMTFWELTDYLAKLMNKSPLKIQIKRDTGKLEVSPGDYCKSLGQLKFESNEELMLMKTQISFSQVPLINPLTGHLVKEAECIFTSWFNQFSVPASELPNLDLTISTKADRYMTKETALNFLQNALSVQQKTTKSVEQLQPDDKRIERLFLDNDTDRDGLLTLEDFLRFYRISSLQKIEVVWGNLSAFGYNNDLSRDSRGEVTYSDDPNLTVNQNSLPRGMIAENTDYLEKLFGLENDDTRSQEQIWRLICSLKTNSVIYNQIFASENLDKLFNPNHPVMKLQYHLQIAKHLLEKEIGQDMKPSVKLYIEGKKIIGGGENYNKEYPLLDQPQVKINVSAGVGLETIEEEKAPEIQFKSLGADSHWERPQVAPAGSVIALPAAAAPQDQQGETSPAQKLSYNQQQINNWKGQVVVDDMPFAQYAVENQEQSIWLVRFLANKGFEALVKLLHHFVSSNAFKSRAQQNCLKQIIHIIKVILMIVFSDTSENSDLVVNLVRKLSHENSASSSTSEQQVPVVVKPLDKLTQQLKLYDITHQDLLAEDPEMIQIQELLKMTFQAILRHQSSCTEEERSIVADCLNIFVSQLTFNPNFIQALYTDQVYVNLLIDQGLLADSLIMRNQFKSTIEFICMNVRHQFLTEQPAKFFLRILMSKLPQVCTNANSRSTQQYFVMLKQLIEAFYAAKKQSNTNVTQDFDFKSFIIQALELLNGQQVKEVKSVVSQADFTLVGLLQLINIMLVNESPLILNDKEREIVIQLLVEQCLFSKPAPDVQFHITKNLDVRGLSQQSLNKCHSQESREAAYNLFQTVVGQSPNPYILEQLVQNFWAPIIMKLERPNNYNLAAPNERSRSLLGFAGIKNLGSICYMNAMIQQFYHVPAFRYCLLAANDSVPPNLVQTTSGRTLDDNNLHQWIRLFGFLELTDRQDYNPEDFAFSFKQDGQPLDVRVQQDAQEFLGNAFDRLENSLKDTPMKYLCQSVFQGQSANLTICKNCNNINQTDEDFYSLPCSVKDQKNIVESLKNLIAGETISDYNCSKCKQKVSIKKQIAIKRLPNTLILHLKRLDFDFNTMMNVKLNDRIEFPNVLSMKSFMLSEVLKDIKSQKSEEKHQTENQTLEDAKEDDIEMQTEETKPEESEPIQEEIETRDEDFEYKLVGVVVHMGQANAGHYISYINIERERDSSIDPNEWMKTENQTWLEFNDSQVKPFDFSQLAYKCFGEIQYRNNNIMTSTNYQDDFSSSAQPQTNAYMLFYEKRVKSDLSFVLDDKTIETIKQNSVSLVCDGTAIPRALQQVHSCLVYPALSERVIRERIEPNTKINVPFYQVEKFVSNDIYKQVSRDNQVYIAELQVYDSHFFDTTTQLLGNLVENTQDFQMLNGIYIVLDKLIFEIVFNSNYTKQLEKLCATLFRLTEKSPYLLSKLVTERILKKEKPVGSLLDQPFFEDLIFHRNQEVREVMESMLTRITQTFCDSLVYSRTREFSEEQLQQLDDGLNQLVQSSLGYLNKSESYNGQAIIWHKLGAYLNFFYNLLKQSSWHGILAFKKHNLVKKLVELISKYKDNITGGQHLYNPPIENALKTISLMVRSQPLLIHLYGLPLESQVNIDEYQQIIEEKGPSPFYKSQSNSHCYLDAADVKSLFMTDAKCKHFWEMSINFTWSQDAREELGQLMQHVCYENYDISKRIAKILIFGLNRTQADEIKPYAISMEHFITIPDQFQKMRIEWIFGLQTISMTKPNTHYYQQNGLNPEVHKIGVSNINDVADNIYDYQSPLVKVQSNSNETILQILYKYRKNSFQEVVLVLLEHLTKAILSDSTGKVLECLLLTDGPSYSCRRYWDWIQPYITQLITDSYQIATVSTNNMDTCFRILDNIEKINTTHKDKIDTFYPRDPYLIWSITQAHDIQTIRNVNKEFHVVLSEFTTQTSVSQPNPAEQSNQSIQKVSRGGWVSSFQLVKSEQKSDKKEKPQYQDPANHQVTKSYGRGQRSSRNANRSGSKPNKVYHNKGAGKELYNHLDYAFEKSDGDDGEDEFPDEQPLPKVTFHQTNDESTQPNLWINNSNEGDKDSLSDRGNFSSEEAIQQDLEFGGINDIGAKINDDNAALDVDMNTGNRINNEITGDFQPDENGSTPEVTGDRHFQDKENDQFEEFVQQEEEKKYEPESEQQTPQKYLAHTIMQLTLRNFSGQKNQKCTLKFDRYPDANYYLPETEISQLVEKRHDLTFIRLMKLRPQEPWGPMSLSFTVDGEDMNGNQTKYERNWPALRQIRIPQAAPPLVQQDPQGDENQNPGMEATDGQISCSACTFFNPLTAMNCEICGNDLT